MTSQDLTPTTAPVVRWTVPAVDVLERDRDLRLLVDLPGVRQDGLELTFEHGRVQLTARRADRTGVGYRRAFALPDHVDATAIQARLHQGVLTLDLPATPAVKPRVIPVAVG